MQAPDIICLSNLRWHFVVQRPQHLMQRFASDRRVFFVEEPVFGEGPSRLELTEPKPSVYVAVPHLPRGIEAASIVAAQRTLVDALVLARGDVPYVLWYYAPSALGFTAHLRPEVTVYDCLDDLGSASSGEVARFEAQLLKRADIVLTAGYGLYEKHKATHASVHPVPGSVDVDHFRRARRSQPAPDDQAAIPRPRLGYCGVVDDRIDYLLLEGIARLRPEWHLVLAGPIVSNHPTSLPTAKNIHYLGMKRYEDLPTYLSGWDVALLPFVRTASRRAASPTKTQEYLASGLRVVSTSIQDAVLPYEELGLVRVGDSVEAFVQAVRGCLCEGASAAWLRDVDAFLGQSSWDRTFQRIKALVDDAAHKPSRPVTASVSA